MYLICYKYQMELRHLRYFIAVAEEMNIHRAAERLNISQPPLSVTIKQLEQEIGTLLFTREGRSIQITSAGTNFLEHAKKIIEHSKFAMSETKEIGEGRKGTLKIGFVSSAVTGIFQNSVYAFRRQNKDVSIITKQLINNLLSQNLINKTIDIGIGRYPEEFPSDIAVYKATRESWIVAMGSQHPFTKKKKVYIEDFKQHCLHFYPRWNSPTGYDDIATLFKSHGVPFEPVIDATEQTAIAGLVASGRGLAVVPACMSKIKFPGVVHRPLVGAEDRSGFVFLTRKESDILVDKFLDIIQNTEFD